MSKSKGNVVDPDAIIEKYGADTVRLFMLFTAPPQKQLEWSDKGVEGCYRFINRVWRLVARYGDACRNAGTAINHAALEPALQKLRNELHITVKVVTGDIQERMQYNTAIARMMELVNAVYQTDEKLLETPAGSAVLAEVFGRLIPMLAPFIPHAASEMWEMLGRGVMDASMPWPGYSEDLARRNEIEVVFQVNGKIRAKEMLPAETPKEELERLALAHERVRELIQGKTVKKVVVIPGKLVNIVAP